MKLIEIVLTVKELSTMIEKIMVAVNGVHHRPLILEIFALNLKDPKIDSTGINLHNHGIIKDGLKLPRLTPNVKTRPIIRCAARRNNGYGDS